MPLPPRNSPWSSVTERYARLQRGRRAAAGGFTASLPMLVAAAVVATALLAALVAGGFLTAPASAQSATRTSATVPEGAGAVPANAPTATGATAAAAPTASGIRPASPSGSSFPPMAAATPAFAAATPAFANASAPAALPGAGAPPTESTPAAPPVRVLLTPARETTLVAQMVGRVERLGGELGGSFKEGAPLVVFDCAEQKARLRMADAEQDAAAQQHETKMRLQALDAAGDAEVKLAATGVVRAQAQVELARQQATHCQIDAPFAGRIVKLHVRESQGVAVGQPLLELVSAGPLKLRLNAPSKWLSWLKPGVAFRITIDETGRSYPAVVSAINARVDAVSQSIEIEGRVRGTYPELLAGMSGNAAFARAR
jgi:membrane fusion protein, multidrug efflux system